MPRYLDKAGVSCERMQHRLLPLEFITLLLSAVFGAQDEGELRRVFELFDASGDGCLDEEEFLAMVPMLGEDVPPEWLGKLFEVIDGDGNSVVTYDEFVKFVRLCNPRGDNDGAPLAADEASGWRALVKGDDHDEKVVLQVARRRSGGAKAGWRSVAMGDLKHLERLGALPIARVDNENAEAVVDRLREMRMPDHQVLAIVRAVFVTQTDEDYAKVFDIFDTDSTGGIDQGEFHQIAALLGERTTLQELRELFIAADRDCNGLLDVDEFSALLRTLSPKMKDKAEAQGARLLVARERLQQRVGEVFGEGRASDEPPTATCKAIVLGASRSSQDLPPQPGARYQAAKAGTTVGFGTVPVAIGAEPRRRPGLRRAGRPALRAARRDLLHRRPLCDPRLRLDVDPVVRRRRRVSIGVAQGEPAVRRGAADGRRQRRARRRQARHLRRLRARLLLGARLDRVLRRRRVQPAGHHGPDQAPGDRVSVRPPG